MEAHKQAVAGIAASVKHFFSRGEPYRIFHGSTNSTRPWSRKIDKGRMVDISALRNVLSVDARSRTALVEPNVPMDRLVAATLAHNLVPPVVMEFPGITAGGGFAGTAGESSSFKNGFFDQTVNEVEMVLANGDVVKASPNERADLFHGAAGAVGTLGITTLLEVQLIDAKKYVKTTYQRLSRVGDTVGLIERKAADMNLDYVDGIIFSKDHGVVITGVMTDDKPEEAKAQTFSYPSDPWFYLHVQEQTRSAADGKPVTEFIPLAEYLFRYDRAGFWVGRSAFDYFKFPFNRATRWFLDDFMKTRMLYRALHASRQSKRYIIQDLALPYESAEAFVDYTADTFGIWPLWLCPLLETPPPTFHPHISKGSGNPTGRRMLNIGLWGQGPSSPEACIALNRDLEDRLHNDFGGMKWLYAHTYYSEEEFWEVYDKQAYDELRKKYGATSLPSVYDKVKDKAGPSTGAGAKDGQRGRRDAILERRPIGGLWGLARAIQSRDYLPRTPPWRG